MFEEGNSKEKDGLEMVNNPTWQSNPAVLDWLEKDSLAVVDMTDNKFDTFQC